MANEHIIIRLKTWRCPDCDYSCDYEPTVGNHAVHFPKLFLADGECPACATGQNPKKIAMRGVILVRETRPEKKATCTVRVADLETEEVVADRGVVRLDGEGKPVKQKVTRKAIGDDELKKLREHECDL